MTDDRDSIAGNEYLMRHVYDLGMVARTNSLPEFDDMIDLFVKIVDYDIKDYRTHCPEFANDPCKVMRESLDRLANEKQFEESYIRGVQQFIYAKELIPYHELLREASAYITPLIDAYEDIKISNRLRFK